MSPGLKTELFATSALMVLLGLCIWLYYPGLSGPALLDDASNIGMNFEAGADLEGGALPSFWNYIGNNDSGPLGRPVSMATFYLEHWFAAPRSFVGKGVNLALHCIIAVLLYVLLRRLLRLINLDSPVAALFATAFWLLAPLHVSTVLYHVQRMAILSALCSLMFMHGWLSLRRAFIEERSMLWPALGAMASGLLAIGAKENAVVALPLVLLLDWFLLGREVQAAPREKHWRRFSKFFLMLLACLALVLVVIASDWITRGYEIRSFTLTERLLTESRILWAYAYQFFVPDVHTLGLSHDDYELSRGLFAPVSTLWAIIALVVGLLALPLFWSNKIVRSIAVGVVFFFTAHLIESSVLALELYFEHRNYLPSVGFAISLAIGGAYLSLNYPETSRAVAAVVCIWLLTLGADLSSQSAIWGDRTAIVLTERAGHPYSARANVAMAVLTANAGDTRSAERYSRVASEVSPSESESDHVVRFAALSCLANQPISAEWYPDKLVSRLGSSSGQSSLEKVVSAAETDACPAFDFAGFSDFLARSLAAKSNEEEFLDLNVMAAALRIERALGRGDRIATYEEILQASRTIE